MSQSRPTATLPPTQHCRFGAVLRMLCDAVLDLPVAEREPTWRLLADHVQQLTVQITHRPVSVEHAGGMP